jgi:hypothetical protein
MNTYRITHSKRLYFQQLQDTPDGSGRNSVPTARTLPTKVPIVCEREKLLAERVLEANAQLGTHVRNLHPGHDNELAALHLPRLIIVRELGLNAAILAILIPAETAVRNRLGAEKLKAPKERVSIWNFHGLPEHFDLYQLLVRPKRSRNRRHRCGLHNSRLTQAAAANNFIRARVVNPIRAG